MKTPREWSVLGTVVLTLVATAGLQASALWIFPERYPTTWATLLGPTGVIPISAFIVSSSCGAWVAWRFRLAERLGPIASTLFWAAAVIPFSVCPVLMPTFAEGYGSWPLCVWAFINSYIFAFMLVNTNRVEYAG